MYIESVDKKSSSKIDEHVEIKKGTKKIFNITSKKDTSIKTKKFKTTSIYH